MNAIPLHILQRLHPFYVASDEADLDAAFEDGKRRYLRSLEREADLVRQATRQDYESAFLGQSRHPDHLPAITPSINPIIQTDEE